MAIVAAGLAFGSAAEAGLIDPGTAIPGGHPLTSGGADPTFIFTYTSNDNTVHATATLSATDNGDGTFTATSGALIVTGPVDPGTYQLIPNSQAPNPNGANIVGGFPTIVYDDQLLFGQDPVISSNGLLFSPTGTDTGLEINIYSTGSPTPNGPYEFSDFVGATNTNNIFGQATLNELSAVPEPSSFMLFGVAALAIVGRFWLRRRKLATATGQ